MKDPLTNIPKEVRNGIKETIDLALSIVTGKKKWNRMASTDSEDAVTWVVFKHLQQSSHLLPVANKLFLESAKNAKKEPTLLLWGTPIPLTSRSGIDTRCELTQACDFLGEKRNTRTEPDVILDFGKYGIVIIEVKYTATQNEYKSATYSPWDKYFLKTDAFASEDGIRQLGLYELARNWRIGWELAFKRNCRFTLVNLGPYKLFQDRKGVNSWISRFGECLKQTRRCKFRVLDWSSFLSAVKVRPEWFQAYIEQKQLGES